MFGGFYCRDVPLSSSIPQKRQTAFRQGEDAVAFLTRACTGEGIDARPARQGETRIEAQFRASNNGKEEHHEQAIPHRLHRPRLQGR